MMSEEPEKLAEGTLISHLLELRDRLLRALVAVGIAFLPCMFYSNDLFSFIAQPLVGRLPEGSNLIATGVMSPFTTPFKLSFFVALMLAMPFVIYHCGPSSPPACIATSGASRCRCSSPRSCCSTSASPSLITSSSR